MTNPDTLRLVPVEPTEAMLKAVPASYSPSMRAMWPSICGDIYRAMIAAAPASPDPDALEKLAKRLERLSKTPVGSVHNVYGPHSVNAGWNEFRRDMNDGAAGLSALIAELREARGLLEILDDHLGEDDRMWSDDSSITSEWIGSDGVRRTLTFGMFRRIRAFLARNED